MDVVCSSCRKKYVRISRKGCPVCEGRFYDPLEQPRSTDCEELAIDIGRLTDEKQAAYGNSYGKSGEVMKILYPNGIQPDQYQDALAVVRVIDKLFRIATDKDAFGESPWRDIAGYALLGARKTLATVN